MAYSIKKAAAPYGDGSTVISDLGSVIEESGRKEGNLNPYEMNFEDSDETETDDFGGTKKFITYRGAKAGNLSALTTMVNNILALINGDQSPGNMYPYQFVSDLSGTTLVKFLDIDYSLTNSSPRILDFTIRMVESKAGV